MRGTVQVDYVFAVSIFLVIFALTMQLTTDYYKKTNDMTDTMLLRSDAMNLLSIADCSYGEQCLQTSAYRFYTLVNNTQENLINQSHSVSDLADELVIFSMDEIYKNPDLNSISIYYNNTPVNYQRIGSEIIFKTDISANKVKIFTVYFDDDSNFADRSVSVTGSNNLTEKLYPIEKIYLLQYRKIDDFMNSGYEFGRAFHINIYDENNQTFLDYGDIAPEKGSVVALQKYVVYQDSEGNVEFGKFVLQLW